MDKKRPPAKTSPVTILGAVAIALLLLDILFLMLAQSGASTVILLNKELENLSQNEKIIASAEQTYSTYKDEITVISSVFPNEKTIPQFVQGFENKLKQTTDDYSFKFNAITPISEQSRLYLPITIVMRTDLGKLNSFLASIETMPYMTHINLITAQAPDGFSNNSEFTINMKVYVQNPFAEGQ